MASVALFKKYLSLIINNYIKLHWGAMLEANPPQWNSTTRQNPPICNPQRFTSVIFEPIMQFESKKKLYLGCPKQKENIWSPS